MKEFLSPEERKELRLQHRSEKDRRRGDRIKAILLSDKGWTFKMIAEALLLDEETISLHVSDYRKKKKLSLETGGSESKLNKEQTKLLIQHLEINTYTTIQEICAYVKKEYDIDYTVSGMTSWMRSHEFSYKKPKGTPAKADPLKQKEFIACYENLVQKRSEDEPILFGDGVHPTMATKITYGWIRTGQDKAIPTTASRTRLNLMGSIDLETMEVTLGSYETIDSVAMEDHFQKLREKYPKARKIHLILDQGSYNTSKATKQAALKAGITLHYLPPYSPNLNPIERLWKVMNEFVRNNRFFKTAQEFRKAILEFFETTWPQISLKMIDRINDSFQIIKSPV